jgi:hypothetical protein
VLTGLVCLRIEKSEEFCECGNKLPVSIKTLEDSGVAAQLVVPRVVPSSIEFVSFSYLVKEYEYKKIT